VNSIFDKLGEFSDRLDSILAMEAVPVPPAIKEKARAASLESLRDDMRAAYVEHTGDNPWEAK
jgi:hypothetical protein